MFRVLANTWSIGSLGRCVARPMRTNATKAPQQSPEPPTFTAPQLASLKTDTIQEYNVGSVLDMQHDYCFPMVKYYSNPFVITRGNMQFLYDSEGKRYLDMFGGVVTVGAGHCHPRITAAAMNQMQKLWHTSSLYYTPHVSQFSKEIIESFPEGSLLREEGVVRLVNSGSEANELALLIAQLYTGNYDMILHRNCFFGMSSAGAMSMTSHTGWRYHIPRNNQMIHISHPNIDGVFGDKVEKYLEDLDQTITYSTSGLIAGMMVEPIQGVGGVHPLLDGYLAPAFDRVRMAGGVCIVSEMQSGFGRTGKSFWAYEEHGVDPDIVVIGKALGNGFPIAAVITRREIANAIRKRMHFNTFGGSPLACAVGTESLRVIKSDRLQQNCNVTGTRLLTGLMRLKEKYPCIQDVRGEGLLVGIEFVEEGPDGNMIPSKRVCNAVLEKAKDAHGVLFGKGGGNINVIRLSPPMCINEQDVDYTLHALDQILGNLE